MAANGTRQPLRKQAVAAAAGFAGGALLAAATALVQDFEGMKLDPYRDIAGRWTVCVGETRAAMRHYSAPECRELLRRALASDFAPGVAAAVPAIREHPGAYAASISLAYNIGLARFGTSSVARQFNAGNWRGGCDAFLAWNRAGGRIFAGLARRRAAERALCLSGLR